MRGTFTPTSERPLSNGNGAEQPANPTRAFIRHTAGVPLEVRPVTDGVVRTLESVNVSVGGLSFTSDEDIPVGTIIQIRVPEVDPPFEALARVVWTTPEEDHRCIGAQFLDAADAFRARMVEQVCAIEQYRQEVLEREGRALTAQQAATEWIAKYAGRFPHARMESGTDIEKS